MKILYVTTISDTIGAFLVPHIDMLLEQGHQVDLACCIHKPLPPSLLNKGCRLYDVPFQRSPLHFKNVQAHRKIRRIVAEGKYDLVHVHTPVAAFLTRLACARFKNLKVVYTAHGFHFYRGASFINWMTYYPMEKLAARWTDAIITINREDFERATSFKMRGESHVFQMHGVGVSLERYAPVSDEEKQRLREVLGYGEQDKLLIHVAELNHNKNQMAVLEAVNTLREAFPKLRLLLVGKGPLEKKYRKYVKKHGLEPFVQLLGWRGDVEQLLQASDAAVSASFREGLPVSIMEALACGLPCIVSDCRGNRDLVVNGVSGIVVSRGGQELVEAIESLFCTGISQNFKVLEQSKALLEALSVQQVTKELSTIYGTFSAC